MRPPVVGFRHPSFRRCKYFAPYRGDIKPPLEVVVMTFVIDGIGLEACHEKNAFLREVFDQS